MCGVGVFAVGFCVYWGVCWWGSRDRGMLSSGYVGVIGVVVWVSAFAVCGRSVGSPGREGLLTLDCICYIVMFVSQGCGDIVNMLVVGRRDFVRVCGCVLEEYRAGVGLVMVYASVGGRGCNMCSIVGRTVCCTSELLEGCAARGDWWVAVGGSLSVCGFVMALVFFVCCDRGVWNLIYNHLIHSKYFSVWSLVAEQVLPDKPTLQLSHMLRY